MRVFLTIEQAIDVLPNKEKIHNFVNAPIGLIGADWSREKVIETLNNAEVIEIGGSQCKALGHALVCIPKNCQRQSELCFFESDMEKISKYEKLYDGGE